VGVGAPDDHWVKPAQSWALRGSPLRPAPEDVRIYEREFRRWHAAARPDPLHGLLLGVTPEIATMPWPPETCLIAADESRAMIRGVWPGAALGQAAVCARWQALPLADGTQHVVIGDGCLSALTEGRYETMRRSLRRVLDPRGLLLLRFFTRPDRSEPVANVFDDLLAGRIGNFHVFKWRLAMAQHGSLSDGVRLADVWDVWHAAVPRPEDLARNLGWPLPVILTIDDFQGVAAYYTFPTLAEARRVMSDGFEEVACHFPAYELGERCPIIAFRPR
jgi:hypothetical protein